MTTNALLQLGLYLGVLWACVKPLGLYMARVYSGRAPFLERFAGPLERLLYRLSGIDKTVEMTWRQYADAVLAFSLVGFLGTYYSPASPRRSAAESRGFARRFARLVVQHGRQLRDEYELAGIRRRDDDELPHADARSDRAEFRLGGRGHGRAGGLDSWLHVARQRTRSATSGSIWCEERCTSCLPLSLVLALVLVSQGVVQTFRPYREVTLLEPTVDADGKTVAYAEDRRWPGGFADCDQAAGHQRRRVLQREFGPSAGEPDAALEPSRNAGDSADPGGPLLHVWRDGRRPPAGLGHLGGDGGRVRPAPDRRDVRRATGQSRSGKSGRGSVGLRASVRAATWRERRPASGLPTRRCGRWRPRPLPTAR